MISINISGNSNPSYLTVYNDKLYFTAYTPSTGRELWSYDESNGAVEVADIYSSSGDSNPSNFAVFNDKLYFNADYGTDGRELWVFND